MSVSRDYANKKRKPTKRPAAKAKSNRGKKPAASKKAKTQTKLFPWSQFFWALIALSAMAYILYTLNNAPLVEPQPIKQPQVVDKINEQEQEDKSIELTKPKFTYHKILKDKELQVDIDQSALKADKNLIMQCGSFLKYEQADRLKAQIAFSGLSAEIKQTTEKDGKVWYRVVLGPYKSKRAADSDNHKLQAVKVNGCRIW